MSKPFSLDIIQVASPCHAAWEGMRGDARVRHCGECQKHVYNLSAMTRAEAETLVQEHEGRLCVRFYQRADGTLLTTDCPVGLLAAAHRRLAGWFAAIAAGLLAMAAFGNMLARGRSVPPFGNGATVTGTPVMGATPMTGKMVVPNSVLPMPRPQSRMVMGEAMPIARPVQPGVVCPTPANAPAQIPPAAGVLD